MGFRTGEARILPCMDSKSFMVVGRSHLAPLLNTLLHQGSFVLTCFFFYFSLRPYTDVGGRRTLDGIDPITDWDQSAIWTGKTGETPPRTSIHLSEASFPHILDLISAIDCLSLICAKERVVSEPLKSF